MATSKQVSAADGPPRKESPAGVAERSDALALAEETPEQRAEGHARTRRMVARMANRHGCTGHGCDQPGHDRDVVAALEVRAALGVDDGGGAA